MKITDSRPFIHKGNYDVIVVGGGVAGVAAAVAAGRHGAKTLLIEKTVMLGGLATVGLISWYEPLCDRCGQQMTGGIAEELLRVLIRDGFDSLPEDWKNKKKLKGNKGDYATLFSPTMGAISLDRFVLDSGAELLFDAHATFPVMKRGRCVGVIAETVEGRVYYEADAVVDATGDASVFHRAGAMTYLGDNYLSGVSHEIKYENAPKFIETNNVKHMRQWKVIGSNLYGSGHPADMPLLHCESAEDVTRYMIETRKMALEHVDEDRFSRDIATLPGMPQFRKIRRIEAEYVFTGEELNVKFPDAIGSCNDFRKKGMHYQIPYRSLYKKEFKNMLAAGRIIGATSEGWEITRVIPVAALTGHAAGMAAAMIALEKKTVSTLSVRKLRKNLKEQGVLFI
ncbi:MAG TPA: hypothetical protein DCY74_08495 [Clostridiales bacterium]|jgi:hypothetical protein|nr:hypothetical protein [Clostridiales bacterium]